MKNFKIFIVGLAGLILASCTFNETLEFNQDGSGIMVIQMDASDIMTMMATMGTEEEKKKMEEKIDTTFYFKDFIAEKKDSIMMLPLKQQNKLKKLEPYGVHIKMDAKAEKLLYEVFVNFNDISQADNMFDVFNQISNTGVNSNSSTDSKGAPKQESIKVKYSYENNIFKRNAYITDTQLHQAELDSLKPIEVMMAGALYKLTYTFPKTIKTVSQVDATISQDRKTLYYEAEYLEYLKNPDVLDIEVVFDY